MRDMRNIQILIVEDYIPNQVIAQCAHYPVRNGSGKTEEDAVADLLIAIQVHLHNKRTHPNRMKDGRF